MPWSWGGVSLASYIPTRLKKEANKEPPMTKAHIISENALLRIVYLTYSQPLSIFNLKHDGLVHNLENKTIYKLILNLLILLLINGCFNE